MRSVATISKVRRGSKAESSGGSAESCRSWSPSFSSTSTGAAARLTLVKVEFELGTHKTFLSYRITKARNANRSRSVPKCESDMARPSART